MDKSRVDTFLELAQDLLQAYMHVREISRRRKSLASAQEARTPGAAVTDPPQGGGSVSRPDQLTVGQ
jgi:hypothetical protein